MSPSILYVSLLCASVIATAAIADDEMTNHGQVDFPNSFAENTQEVVTEGILLLHQMEQDQADAGFRAAATSDPASAMAEWGVAMGRLSRMTATTAREAVCIAAAKGSYDKDAEPYPQRLKAWATEQRARPHSMRAS